VQEARRLGLAGWVRNRSDGSVEALFSGDEEVVEAMIARCHDGPPAARVAAVRSSPADAGDLPGPRFDHRPTL
jgi:acylphosphatase